MDTRTVYVCFMTKILDCGGLCQFLISQEIAAAADKAARKYREKTSPDDVTPQGPTIAMLDAVKVKTAALLAKFFKLAAVANPGLGADFFEEVRKHWSFNTDPEMTLEKLQLIATSVASAPSKCVG